ncbi:hypothetical protein Nepgr_021417 [Nepenthes gracilis]|uniref:Uncharacterized protein n=1 Tax=Nepenthes gracilis TaxID=150966 RepID=A0AAD3XXC1_NEPGR|nr:hypothetical protein Nepgr_021417 [Nepenthes gracilis]
MPTAMKHPEPALARNRQPCFNISRTPSRVFNLYSFSTTTRASVQSAKPFASGIYTTTKLICNRAAEPFRTAAEHWAPTW